MIVIDEVLLKCVRTRICEAGVKSQNSEVKRLVWLEWSCGSKGIVFAEAKAECCITTLDKGRQDRTMRSRKRG